MSTPASQVPTPIGEVVEPGSQQESDPNPDADGVAREHATAKGDQPARSPDHSAEEKPSREETRDEQDRIRSVRAAGLDSLRPTLGFAGATSFGGPAAGRDLTFNFATATRTPSMGPVPVDTLAALRDVYVRFPGYAEARQRLMTARVMVLHGQEGSGRRASALELLRSLVDGQIFNLRPDQDLESLFSDDSDGNCGYFLDSVPATKTGKLTPSLLSSAEHWLENSQSFLVITVAALSEAQCDDLERYLVDHRAPDPYQVLCSHLRRQCDELPDPLPSWLDDDRLLKEVNATTQPSPMVNLAIALLKAVKDERSIDDILDYWTHGRACTEARRLLRGTQQADPELRPTEQLQRCAFLVAIAAFNDAPYLPVAAAAELLAQSLTAAAYPKGTPHRQIFALRRENCLTWLQGTVERRLRNERWGEQCTEQISLRNQGLPSALLDELWHEYDAVRTPVLRWLEDLAVSRNPEIRVRAAQAIGKLAADDFDYVYQEVIYEWAGSRWAGQRYAAAWALEAAVRTGDTEDRVRWLLRYWCSTGSRYRKLTAVTTYGTSIGTDRPEEALRSLRYLARADDPEMTRIACNSVVELYLGGQSDQVLDTWYKWQSEGDGIARRFAIESFVQLAYQHDDNGRPVLPPLCAEGHRRADLMATLWRYGLNEDYSRADAWEALWQWCRDADRYPDLRAPLEHLFNTLKSTDEDRRDRFFWYLNFWATHPKEPSNIAKKLYSVSRED